MKDNNILKTSGACFALTMALMVGGAFSAGTAHAGFFDKLNEVIDSAKASVDSVQEKIDGVTAKVDEATESVEQTKAELEASVDDVEANINELQEKGDNSLKDVKELAGASEDD